MFEWCFTFVSRFFQYSSRGQEHRVNTNKEDKPTRALILVGCTFVELEEHRCTRTSVVQVNLYNFLMK